MFFSGHFGSALIFAAGRMQFHGEPSVISIDAFGFDSLKTTVSGSGVSIEAMSS
jgi:hypothetical protein